MAAQPAVTPQRGQPVHGQLRGEGVSEGQTERTTGNVCTLKFNKKRTSKESERWKKRRLEASSATRQNRLNKDWQVSGASWGFIKEYFGTLKIRLLHFLVCVQSVLRGRVVIRPQCSGRVLLVISSI